MCDACEDPDALAPRPAPPSPRLLRRARAIERSLPGTPVPDAAWRIATGEQSGAIAWTDHLRIATAFDAARAAAPPGPRRRAARFACDAG